MISAQIIGADAVIAKLGAMPDRVVSLLRAAVEREAIALTGYVKESKLSGQVLRNRTGTLRRSINYAMIGDLAARVGTNLVYAAIHEYGGQTRAHVIEAKNAKALAFQVGGQSSHPQAGAAPGLQDAGALLPALQPAGQPGPHRGGHPGRSD